MLSKTAVQDLIAEELFPKWRSEKTRLDRIDDWYRWKQEEIKLPRRSSPELKRLAEVSKIPWLNLVVSSVSQCMYVDGHRSMLDQDRAEGEMSRPWRTWNANGFDQRQAAVHRAALAYGYSFVTVIPGEDFEGERQAVLRGVSPRKMFAVYEDPAEDDWPKYAIRVSPAAKKGYRVRLYDETHIYHVQMDESNSKPEYVEDERHDAGVCPVVRYANMLDLDGRCDGEVEPFIPAAARVSKTSLDRMLTQHYTGWKVRTVVGMAKPDTEEQANKEKLKLRQDDVLVADDPDTKFGTLDESPLNGLIDSWKADIEALAAVSQTPTHMLTGALVNLSAEALAASRAGLTQKVYERQKQFGKSHVQALRLAAQLDGFEQEARDVTARVTWQDMEIRSISQAVDALGKAATMLEVPVEFLWSRIPGIEKSDVDEWKRARDAADPLNRYTDELARQSVPALPSVTPPPNPLAAAGAGSYGAPVT